MRIILLHMYIASTLKIDNSKRLEKIKKCEISNPKYHEH